MDGLGLQIKSGARRDLLLCELCGRQVARKESERKNQASLVLGVHSSNRISPPSSRLTKVH